MPVAVLFFKLHEVKYLKWGETSVKELWKSIQISSGFDQKSLSCFYWDTV